MAQSTVMNAKKSFLDQQKFPVVAMDESYSMIMEQPLRGIELRPYQRISIKAMLEVEKSRTMTIKKGNSGRKTAQYYSNSFILSDPFGSGKTLVLLAFICLKPIPSPKTEYISRLKNKGSKNIITRKFTGKSILRPNMILVSSAALMQWERAISDYTNFTMLRVGDAHGLRILMEELKSDNINKYDIILVKNGNTTIDFVSGVKVDSSESIVSAIARYTSDMVWARAIYDDYDVISISKEAYRINALSTVFVSTTHSPKSLHYNVENEATPVSDVLTRNNPILLINDDRQLPNVFRIRCDDEFIKQCNKLPVVKMYKHVHVNGNANYVNLIVGMSSGGDNDLDNLAEALNSDAFLTAAQQVGIKSNSVADIFKKVLDDKYDLYMRDQKIIDRFERCFEMAREGFELTDDDDNTITMKPTAIAKVLAMIEDTAKPMPDELPCDDGLIHGIRNKIAEYNVLKAEHGKAIDRVISNARAGNCQVCTLPLAGVNTFVMPCCGVIVCDVCGIKSSNFRKWGAGNDEKTTGRCTNCKRNIELKELIMIDRAFDISNIEVVKGDEQEEISKPIQPPEQVRKIDTLINIIHGNFDTKNTVYRKIDHLMEGTTDIPVPQGIARKVLVFSNYDETSDNIQHELEQRGIKYYRLMGTYQELDNTIKRFKEDGEVLIINSRQNCASLNLQFATDIVFMHKIIDHSVEAQVAGRVQRIGKTYNTNMHWIIYDTESF
ncbi:putative helicase [Faustovirus]|nr:putative helicase [Faustovirus]AMP44044.1 putative helicase [Faustovirus]